MSSIFDPFGFVAPLLFHRKSILQELCRREVGCRGRSDKRRSQSQVGKGEIKFVRSSAHLNPLMLQARQLWSGSKRTTPSFLRRKCQGLWQCSYLRLVNENQRVHCSFVMGKSRVAPLKPVTIPRLEFSAAVCSVRISQQLQRELEYTINQEYFWTDSKVVLGYIANESRRFHVFVVNRVQENSRKHFR